MRWSIVRLIWFRELRDQLRDRRTIFMIAVLPVFLYPVAGIGLMQLARGFINPQNAIGIVGSENLPPWSASGTPSVQSAGWLSLMPPGPGCLLGGIAPAWSASGLGLAHRLEYPPLLDQASSRPQISSAVLAANEEPANWLVRTWSDPALASWAPLEPDLAGKVDRRELDNKRVDLLIVVPPDFRKNLEKGRRATLYLLTRPDDERSRLVSGRFGIILGRWKAQLKVVRLLREGLPPDYDDPLEVRDSEQAKLGARRASEELFKLLAQVFPFVLVMWSLAGALYPAVDLCAGEKERGTMETLLISPASREEIVWGKFLTIWVFSAATALLNLLSMGLTTWQFSRMLAHDPFRPSILFWGTVLLLPLSAFFSATGLAVGVYARSSKEGQYYLMPLFLLTMPLILLTLAPGVELNPFYCMVPVTGVALLLQGLMISGTPTAAHWLYFLPVLAPMVIYSWLALRWAIEQFQREEVLFREAERLDINLWLKSLFREKERLPSNGQALFCFGLILALRWLSFTVGTQLPLLTRTGVSQLGFVATPPLFMALILTTRPLRGLGLRWPPAWAWPAAALLAALLFLPLVELTLFILHQFPGLKLLLEQGSPLTGELQDLQSVLTPLSQRLLALVVLGLLPALCEEVAFRGLILTGLARRFKPWTAILLSSFLFSLYQMNVFQLVPHFVQGVVLGLLVLRTGSLFPAMVFHLVNNLLAVTPAIFPDVFAFAAESGANLGDWSLLRLFLAGTSLVAALGLLAGIWMLSCWRLPESEEVQAS